jgi:hypothetical protein
VKRLFVVSVMAAGRIARGAVMVIAASAVE